MEVNFKGNKIQKVLSFALVQLINGENQVNAFIS